jgi:hypothetical protein
MIVLFLLLACLAAPVGAQESGAPGEPDIVLPEVILRVEDFSVERLTGAAPGEAESLPAARELPLPAGEQPLLSEPPAPPPIEAEVSAGRPGPAQRALSALAELGAGSSNHLFSQVALRGLGEDPRFSLRFLHETLDGFAGEEPGSGFDFRQEELEGALKFHLGKAALEFDGALREEERGLQGLPLPAAISRLLRTGDLGAGLSWPFAEHWTLSGSLNGAIAEQLLTVQTGAASRFDEQKLSPQLSLEMRFPRFWLAVDGRYAIQFLDGEPFHRAGALARFGVEVSKAVRLQGEGGWHWSDLSAPEHLFPFDLTLSLTPAPSVSIEATGGYRVQELGPGELAAAYPWSAWADRVLDDHGWFGDLTAAFSFLRSFTLKAGGHLSFLHAAPEPQTTPDLDGLFPLDQVRATQAAVEASLRWTPARESYLAASWRMELIDHPAFSPVTELRLEAGVGSAKWGANGALAVKLGYEPAPPDFTLTPELSLGAFYQPTEAIRLVAEGEDLLSPLSATGKRLDWDPFLSPGIRATFKVQINL